MIEAQRHTAILELLDKNRLLTVKDIISNFNISPATARRDISKLEGLGKVKKVRNGIKAISQKGTHWSPLNIYSAYNVDEKARIAKKAASICNNGDSIVINCGSTAFLLGQEICGRDIQVITNYFPLMSYLIAENHDGLVIVGGQYHRKRCLTIAPESKGSNFLCSKLYVYKRSRINE